MLANAEPVAAAAATPGEHSHAAVPDLSPLIRPRRLKTAATTVAFTLKLARAINPTLSVAELHEQRAAEVAKAAEARAAAEASEEARAAAKAEAAHAWKFWAEQSFSWRHGGEEGTLCIGELSEWKASPAKCPAALSNSRVLASTCEFFADGCDDWGLLSRHTAHHAGLKAALSRQYWAALHIRRDDGAFRKLSIQAVRAEIRAERLDDQALVWAPQLDGLDSASHPAPPEWDDVGAWIALSAVRQECGLAAYMEPADGHEAGAVESVALQHKPTAAQRAEIEAAVQKTSWLPSAKQWWADRAANQARESAHKNQKAEAKAMKGASATNLKATADATGWLFKQVRTAAPMRWCTSSGRFFVLVCVCSDGFKRCVSDQGKGFWKKFERRWFVVVAADGGVRRMMYYDSERAKVPNGWIESNNKGAFAFSAADVKLDMKDRKKFPHHFTVTATDGTPYTLAAPTAVSNTVCPMCTY